MKRVVYLISGLALCLTVAACQRLEVARPLEGRGRGELPRVHLAYRDALPAEFGDLIGVTSNADYPAWAQAWFMKPDKSIVIVWINARTGNILEEALVLPRK
jgi:hypothetical protein